LKFEPQSRRGRKGAQRILKNGEMKSEDRPRKVVMKPTQSSLRPFATFAALRQIHAF
jgi:hypothetical protein